MNVRLRIRKLGIPLIHDALVLGRVSGIECGAMKKALSLLHGASFEDLEFGDEVIGNVLVRSNILLRIPRDELISLIVRRVKPLMTPDEIMHLGIEPEVLLEDRS